ncbi:hypothetical protein AJ85_04145 [Alkalihalobacillus alcalophilus ATCC 27647 = CGMCC 1.3604]|uniref:Uncharacterized protein n=1 Tax=Alkalihalobacillus alcalophilus ATCC 27647 = CGMCC 1.3604 TaxID=1218173 RepID=A0A094WQQ7_ALKAL|nr:hypothetical protein [Alkalihalobacillus alcalophilus]KGA98363.1 hypothetical protein BALCAV_0204585 [Alkalihalobacillus alcalophilus ATCC 27647 = CGMCC 1.3604]MED1563662.1 hypothetical protein [Alkalihalobacillus alcalophilus]THG91633.1 hypothetical protein AJ85_04145 [Alkalihalobacillus alcalophilus ATCC 27647 = CGMCC 1.3604]
MNKKLNREEALSLLQRTYKPGVTLPILMTLIGIAVYGGLWLDIKDGHYNRIGLFSAVIAPLMIVIGSIWTAFIFRMFQYKKELRDYKKDPARYEW